MPFQKLLPMNKFVVNVLLLAAMFLVVSGTQAINLYPVGSVPAVKSKLVVPAPKPKQQPNNCIKQPEIIKKAPVRPEPKAMPAEKPKSSVAVKSNTGKDPNSIPHFSIFNFFDAFYTKDTLDRLKVM